MLIICLILSWNRGQDGYRIVSVNGCSIVVAEIAQSLPSPHILQGIATRAEARHIGKVYRIHRLRVFQIDNEEVCPLRGVTSVERWRRSCG